MDTIRYELEVTAANYEDCNVPDTAEVILTQELIDHILKLHKGMFDLNCYKIVSFDNAPEWFIENEPDDPSDPESLPFPIVGKFEVQVVSLEIFKESVSWSGIVMENGYTEAHIETEDIPIADIIEINEILNTPEDELPLWIEKVKSEKGKELLERRLSK